MIHFQKGIKVGISDAHTYYWIHNMNAMGNLRSDITANHPIALSFEKDGQLTYVAYNYSEIPINVTFLMGINFMLIPDLWVQIAAQI